jgi:lipoyl synthase
MKPEWLNKKINFTDCAQMKQNLRSLHLETVCEQAMCPNIGECFKAKVATFLILGKNCTRSCSFCNVQKALPSAVDKDEPERVAQAAALLGLKHVVVTSVTRDDLSDGGAALFADTVSRIKRKLPGVTIELLIPDFKLSQDALKIIVDSRPQIVAHNVETVPSLYKVVRQGADYARSLEVLSLLKNMAPDLKTKSGLMLGLGEKEEEVFQVMRDLRVNECDLLSIGQYLAPSQKHYPVKEYIRLQQFADYEKKARQMGFAHVKSAPYVRSSYLADKYLS